LLSAQINESDTLNIQAKISLTGFWQGGNVKTLIFRAKSDLSFKPLKKLVFKTQNSYVYQEFGGQKADEDVLSLNFLYFNPERKIYPLVLGFFSTNFRRQIDLRYLVGAGVSFEVYKKKENWLKLALSSEYEHTDFDNISFNHPEYNGNKTISTYRSTIWVSGKYNLFKNKLIFNHEFYVQPSLSQIKNYRWQADVGFELPIWKYLNFKINYLHTYESIVIENQKPEDSVMSFGFTLKSF
jgi:hypothetical protein